MTTDDWNINATPTKEFFVTMLTKDVDIFDAILDLVDNSVDGALRFREGRRDFTDLIVDVNFSNIHFEISDNCGGIDPDIARTYAFRFGRPDDIQPVANSIGRFGVGMKRAIFKFGRYFNISSRTPEHTFDVHLDITQWMTEPEWDFRFDSLETNDPPLPQELCGTNITVLQLDPEIAERFSTAEFQNELVSALRSSHNSNLQNGLSIRVNGDAVAPIQPDLLASQNLSPLHIRTEIDDVSSVFVCGVGESDPRRAGWYVYCNGRQILSADQERRTGWGEDTPETAAPKYHNQFARFRGYVYFVSMDPRTLPWNTAKNGVDEDSRIWRAARLIMIRGMRHVIDFLNRLDEENELGSEAAVGAPLHRLVTSARRANIAELPERQTFFYRAQSVPARTMKRISYSKPEEEFNAVAERLGATLGREIGEQTFDYFYEREIR